MSNSSKRRDPEATRQRLIDAARGLILQRGFSAAGVEQICADAGVTKGAFFHHFPSKEALGQAALASWAAFGMALYAQAKSGPRRHPLDHLHAFFDIMVGFVDEAPGPVTCVVGIMSQELALANPELRESCSRYLGDWTDFARELLEEAKSEQPPAIDFDAEDVSWYLNSLWQGSMLVAKTRQDPDIIRRNLARARAHVDALFGFPTLNPNLKKTPHEQIR